jgi:hypothetical protein
MVFESVIPQELAAALTTLGRLTPMAARRAAEALEVILAQWHASCDGPHRGRLTGDGFPVELVFSNLDTAIRYTCEVGGPGMAPKERLESVRNLLSMFGEPASFPLHRLQEGSGQLHWGAWLGGRHTRTTGRYKVYVEAPEELVPAARKELADRLGDYRTLLQSHAYALRIVAFEPGSERLEFYFRGCLLQPKELAELLRFSGLAQHEEDLFCLLEETSRQPSRVRLPGTQHGFSLSLKVGGEIEIFTFFVFARSLFGTDLATRSALLSLAAQHGWNLEHYSAVSAGLEATARRGPSHGMVSFIVRKSDLPSISIGLRP